MNETQASVAARLAELATLPMTDLRAVWDRYFTRRPDDPNRTHIESRLAYKIQEEAFGGLAVAARQRLEAIGAQYSKIKLRAKPREFNFDRIRSCCGSGGAGAQGAGHRGGFLRVRGQHL